MEVVELIYKTQDTPLFLVIIAGLVLMAIVIVYIIYSQSRNGNMNNKEEIDEQDISYNIYGENKEEIIKEENVKEEVKLVEDNNDILSLGQSEEEEIFDLKSLSKELESLPRERTITLTPYELEQEEQAIISYDELVTQSIPRLEISKALKEEVLFDYDSVELPVVKEEKVIEEVKETVVNDKEYSHEETFLNHLKDLKNSLN